MSELLTSIGHLGVAEPRQDGRYYLNAAEPFSDLETLTTAWENHTGEATLQPDDISRVVLRGMVTDEVLKALQADQMRHRLEVALPLGEFDHANNNLVYLGQNSFGREPLVPIQEIVEKTLTADTAEIILKRTPSQTVQRAVQSGNVITTSLPEQNYEMLHNLWGPVFGWARDEKEGDQIAALGERLEEEQTIPQSERSVWFAAVHNAGGLLVSAVMAERLTVPGVKGPIDLVETTEWARLPEYQGKSHTSAALSTVNAQVLHNLNGSAVIYAETNFTAGAHGFGATVGLAIPSRAHANQILPQNVTVGDGHEPPGLRDFNFMYLPSEARELYYDPRQINTILSMVDLK